MRCLSWLQETRTQLTYFSCGLAAWFDLYDLSKLAVGMSDKQGIAEATNYLGQLVEEEIKAGIPAERIAVGGFSQVSTSWMLSASLGSHTICSNCREIALYLIFDGMTHILRVSGWMTAWRSQSRCNMMPIYVRLMLHASVKACHQDQAAIHISC